MKEIDVYTQQLREGNLSRRQFAKLIGGLGLGAAAAGSVIGNAWAETPKNGGNLRMVFHNASQQETFDPIKIYSRMMGPATGRYTTASPTSLRT